MTWSPDPTAHLRALVDSWATERLTDLAELGIRGVEVEEGEDDDHGTVTFHRADGRDVTLTVRLDIPYFPDIMPTLQAPAPILDALRAVTGPEGFKLHETTVDDLDAMVGAYFANAPDERIAYLTDLVPRLLRRWITVQGAGLYQDGLSGAVVTMEVADGTVTHWLTIQDAGGAEAGALRVSHPAIGHIPADYEGEFVVGASLPHGGAALWAAGRLMRFSPPADSVDAHADRLLALVRSIRRLQFWRRFHAGAR
jgi:hypothetical protein